jgi:hypothetical protein
MDKKQTEALRSFKQQYYATKNRAEKRRILKEAAEYIRKTIDPRAKCQRISSLLQIPYTTAYRYLREDYSYINSQGTSKKRLEKELQLLKNNETFVNVRKIYKTVSNSMSLPKAWLIYHKDKAGRSFDYVEVEVGETITVKPLFKEEDAA